MSSPIDMPHQKRKTPLPQPIIATTILIERTPPKTETGPINEELLRKIEDLQKQIIDTRWQCFKCGKTGHFAQKCYYNQPQTQIKDRRQPLPLRNRPPNRQQYGTWKQGTSAEKPFEYVPWSEDNKRKLNYDDVCEVQQVGVKLSSTVLKSMPIRFGLMVAFLCSGVVVVACLSCLIL